MFFKISTAFQSPLELFDSTAAAAAAGGTDKKEALVVEVGRGSSRWRECLGEPHLRGKTSIMGCIVENMLLS